jgi:aspartate 1-decarboxylase
VIGVNGAAAHLIHPGDIVIIIAYAMVADHEVPSFRSRVVHVDGTNRCVALGSDPAASLAPDCERSPLATQPPAVTR